MNTFVTIFFVALVGLVGLFGYKAWQIKRGIITIPREEPGKKKPKLTLRLLEKVLVYWVKVGVQNLALLFVKYWLISTNWIKEKFFKRFPNARHWFYLKHGDPEKGPASLLLHNVAEYKMNVEKIKKTIKQRRKKTVTEISVENTEVDQTESE